MGLFGPGAELAGVAVFSDPMNQHVIPSYTGGNAGDGRRARRPAGGSAGAGANSIGRVAQTGGTA